MRWSRVVPVLGIVALSAHCDSIKDNGCNGGTCPFPDPTHHAVVTGVVLDTNEQPLKDIYTKVSFDGQVYSGVGTQTDELGRFTATALADRGANSPDTMRAWVQDTKAIPPPAQPISDSVEVLLQFKPRTELPVVVNVTLHLAVTP